jgi:hypothetical protein
MLCIMMDLHFESLSYLRRPDGTCENTPVNYRDNRLMLFAMIIVVYSENLRISMKVFCEYNSELCIYKILYIL